MIKRYYSNYTGQQIDEAVKAIADKIELDDLHPDLVTEIKKWISEGGSGGSTAEAELVFDHHMAFPNVGSPNKLYIATQENVIYIWKDNHYVAIANAEVPQISEINGGGAQEDGRN